MDEAATIEQQRWEQLQEERLAEKEKSELGKKLKKRKKAKLTFLQKVSKYWLILTVAAFFDVVGLVPGLSVVTNFIFGLILWLYFVLRKTKGGNDLLHIGLPILGGSIVDFFIGIVPTCLAATLIKIALKK